MRLKKLVMLLVVTNVISFIVAFTSIIYAAQAENECTMKVLK